MEEYGAATYGDRIADAYDDRIARMGIPKDEVVELIAELATTFGATTLLELAIGTGRIALPLKERGFELHGIDASRAMVAKLREKPGGAEIPVTMGDFEDVPVEGAYHFVYLVFNTLFALLTQESQIRCFENVAAHLEPGGIFLIECFVPDLSRFDRGQRVNVIGLELDRLAVDASVHHEAEQRIDSMHLEIEAGEIKTYPVKLRYAWPSELDLMARIAGLSLRERWGGWHREPFDDGSPRHVSVYEKPRV